MIARNCKPNHIKKAIFEKNISPLTLAQIKNLKSRVRQKENISIISNPISGFTYDDLNMYLNI
jgi:hypothetical protein